MRGQPAEAPGTGPDDRPGDRLDDALAAAGASPRLLVASDFDGVLAPFVPDPADARGLPASMAALRALAGCPQTWAALVSGRHLDSLRAAAEVDAEESLVLVGSHGAERHVPVSSSTSSSTSSGAASGAARTARETSLSAVRGAVLPEDLAALASTVEQALTTLPGGDAARIEHKAAGIAVHTRGLPPDQAHTILEAATAVGRGRPGLRTIAGKSVVELTLSHADKGSALLKLAAELGATAVLYAGDDVTDEDAFRALTDDLASAGLPSGMLAVPVKVGAGSTVAPYRVADEAAVAGILTELARLRAERCA